jgi:hypothetical protein
MPSAYLAGPDLTAYGVPNATAAQITMASAVVDAFLQRPEGLVWSPDYQGAPAFMAALSPSLALTSTGAVSPGSSVLVLVTGYVSADLVGQALVFDRADPNKTETCVVSAVAPGAIILALVAHAHSATALLEAGLTIYEERALPSQRSIMRIAKPPVVRLISGQGRYSYGRRSDQTAGLFLDQSILSSLQAFGGPPQWLAFDVTQASVSNVQAEVWVPAGIYAAQYSDVRLWYVAGYPTSAIPAAVKAATAAIIGQAAAFPELTGNTKSLKAGDTAIERFKDSILDADTRATLAPYAARSFF